MDTEEQIKNMESDFLKLISPTEDDVLRAGEFIGGDISKLSAAVLKGSVARLESFKFGRAIVFNAVSKDLSGCVPVGVAFNEKKAVVICSEQLKLFDGIDSKGGDEVVLKAVFDLLNEAALHFFDVIKKLESIASVLQASLYRSLKNKELIKLLELQKSLIYFSSALRANAGVVKRLRSFLEGRLNGTAGDRADEVIMRFEDAFDAAVLSRDILSGTMDAFGSIISNNQNKVMKLLTAITILLTVPTVIGSLWGMNVKVPFGHNPMGFLIIIIATIAMLVPIVILMVYKKML